MKKKELLNEIMSVPKSIDFWVDMFSYILTGMAKGILKQEEIEETDFDWVDPDTKEEKVGTMYKNSTQMDGKEVMSWVYKLGDFGDVKGLLGDSKFKDFPLFNPKLKLTMLFLPDRVYEIESKHAGGDMVEGGHGWAPSNIKLAKLGGNNQVFVGQEFSFTIYSPGSWLDGKFDAEYFRKMVKMTVSHELTHAYETYQRFKHKGDPMMGRETFLNVAAQVMSDKKFPQWKEFLHLVYLHLSFEMRARMTQLYYELKHKNVSTKEEAIDVVKKSSVYREIKMLENFDAEKFIDSFSHKTLGFMEMMSDMGKQASRKKTGLKPIFTTGDKETNMKNLIDGWNVALQFLNKELTGHGMYQGKLMDEVPKKALEDPMVFFKFFENRFHKKAENAKRKVFKVMSLVLNEKNEEKLDK